MAGKGALQAKQGRTDSRLIGPHKLAHLPAASHRTPKCETRNAVFGEKLVYGPDHDAQRQIGCPRASKETHVPPSKFDHGHQERTKAAAEAKRAAVEQFRQRAEAANDPEVMARRAAAAASQAARQAKRAEAQELRKLRAEEERVAKAAAAAAAIAAAEAEKIAAKARAEALLKEQKAARDARYAARKARK